MDRRRIARRAHFTEVLAEWNPERRGELADCIRQMSRDPVADAPHRGD